jgi:hypothetical protein
MTEDFYNPDEPKFSHRLFIRSTTTGRTLKVIDIAGEFVVSFAALAVDNISLGRFGRINNWKYLNRTIVLLNKTNIELSMTVSCPTQFFKLPERILGIKPLTEYQLPLVVIVDNCQEEGEKSSIITFTNLNNPVNILKCTVTFAICHSFLKFDHITKMQDDNYILALYKPNQVVESDIPGHSVLNAWFRVTNKLSLECIADITIDVLIQGITIELFHRRSDVQIRSLDLQPNESVEIQVKAIVSPGATETLLPDQTHLFARLSFTAEDVQSMIVDITFQNSKTNPV